MGSENLWPAMTAPKGQRMMNTLRAAEKLAASVRGITNYAGGGSATHLIREGTERLAEARAQIQEMTPDAPRRALRDSGEERLMEEMLRGYDAAAAMLLRLGISSAELHDRLLRAAIDIAAEQDRQEVTIGA